MYIVDSIDVTAPSKAELRFVLKGNYPVQAPSKLKLDSLWNWKPTARENSQVNF